MNFNQLGVGEINPFPGPHTLLPIPAVYSEAIIGHQGLTIKQIFSRTFCYIFVPREEQNEERVFQLSGSPDAVERCSLEIMSIVTEVQEFCNEKGETVSESSVYNFLEDR